MCAYANLVQPPPLRSFRGYIERVSATVNYLLDSPFGPLTPQQMHKTVGVKNTLPQDAGSTPSTCVCQQVCTCVHGQGLELEI